MGWGRAFYILFVSGRCLKGIKETIFSNQAMLSNDRNQLEKKREHSDLLLINEKF